MPITIMDNITQSSGMAGLNRRWPCEPASQNKKVKNASAINIPDAIFLNMLLFYVAGNGPGKYHKMSQKSKIVTFWDILR